MCETKRGKFIVGVVFDQNHKMVGQEPSSPNRRVFMTEEKALFYEFECGDSQQGSSSKGSLWAVVPSARALSYIDAGPSGRAIEEVDSEETEVVYS